MIISWSTLLTLQLVLASTSALERNELFPFGPQANDENLDDSTEDTSSPEIHLGSPVNFFGRQYEAIYVNENGLVSFLTEIPSFFNVEFPMDYPLIAPLYADVDARGNEGGHVYYRVSRANDDLVRVSSIVNDNFGDSDFVPNEAIVATWDQVGYYDGKTDKRNSFQLVLASSATMSYALLLYPLDGVQWTRAEGKNRNVPDAKAQAAISSGQGNNHILRGSGTDQIRSLTRWSNANKEGLWVFRIGSSENEEEGVVEPDIELESRFKVSGPESCESGGRHICHSMATCTDVIEANKFCCRCNNNYFGDGQTCVESKEARRVTGAVSGRINGRNFVEQDFHSYAVPSEGRTYTALSKIDGEIGFEMLYLISVGVPVAWLFATNSNNGFEMCGGVFNYSSELSFADHRASIDFQFLGLDAFEYLRMRGSARGTLPPFLTRPQSQIMVDDYELNLVQVKPGLLSANIRLVIYTEDRSRSLEVDIVHKFEFEPKFRCTENQGESRQTVLKTSRNYIVYDKDEQIVRFALTSSVSSDDQAISDACAAMDCGDKSYCRVEEDAARCACHAGFEKNADAMCVDVDECQTDMHDCSQFAECVNEMGAFSCRCKEGYVGDGIECRELITCERLQCASHAECLLDLNNNAYCECVDGFEGDGHTRCAIVPSIISISGQSRPREITFSKEEAQKEFSHVYEITNQGPHTVGHVNVVINWPAKESSESALSIVEEPPLVQYLASAYTENCEPLLDRVRRNEYIYDANLTSQEYPEFEDYQEKLELLYTAPDGYDYSHFERLIKDENIEDEYYKCDLTLAPQESALITTRALLNVEELNNRWGHVALMQLESSARIEPNEAIANEPNNRERNKANVVLLIKPREPVVSQVPGKGVMCGSVECSPYADCHMHLAANASSEEKCVCVAGFKGDGIDCQLYEGEDDCRRGDQCHVDAECHLDEDQGLFRCRCRQGMEGDGLKGGQGCFYNENYGSNESKDNGDNDNGKLVEYTLCRSDTECDSDAHCDYNERINNYVCICNEVNNEESRTCLEVKQEVDQAEVDQQGDEEVCSSHEMCGINGYCDYNEEKANYYCVCNENFHRENNQCKPNKELTCEITKNCGENAECLLRDSVYTCKCKEGFIGDGKNCLPDVIGCNVINDCAKYAACVFDSSQHGYRCQCDQSRGFVGDGKKCRPARGCRSNPRLCDVNAVCDERNECVCREHFFGDGYTCEASKRLDGEFLLLSQGMAIVRLDPTEQSKGRPIMFKPFLTASDIDIDCRRAKLYWTDTSGRVLGRSNYDGSQSEQFVRVNLSFPEGLALDFWGRKLYFTDAGKRTIEVVDIDDSDRRAIIAEQRVERPRAIAVHSLIGRLFWTDWDRRRPRLESSNLDGSNRFVLIETELARPNGLAIDLDRYEICWTDAGDQIGVVMPKIECSDINGNGRRVVVELGKNSQPFGVALTEHTLYFTDWNRYESNMNKSGSNEFHTNKRDNFWWDTNRLSHVLENMGRPLGIVAVVDKCPDVRGLNHACVRSDVDNLCDENHMCLGDGRGGHSCVCIRDCDQNRLK